ncbi:E3 binding domain-containing protein, partial [Enterobacter hormaechei]|nr:E3 binding domain-containing protein [Enterobacter hormaechei]
ETDKVVLEVPASEAGVLEAILEEKDATVLSRQLLGRIRLGDSTGKPAEIKEKTEATLAKRQTAGLDEESNDALSPAVRRLIAEHDLDAKASKGRGVGGRIVREDVEQY